MILFFLVAYVIMGGALVILYMMKQRADKAASLAKRQAEAAKQEYSEQISRAQASLQEAINQTQAKYEQKIAELDTEAERIRQYYEKEAGKVADEANRLLAELEPLRAYSSLKDAETEVRKKLADAIAEASALHEEAQSLLSRSRETSSHERLQAQQQAKDIFDRANAYLTQATCEAGQIVAEAEKQAKEIGGDAYSALRDKQTLEHAVEALWNTVEGYGDRYVMPTHSLLDDLAAQFGYTEAGAALRAARERARHMVEQKQAATCNYEEPDRRDRANRFIVDAFNGRVDALLTRTRYDNYGTLVQEIRDAFSLVNLNGLAFRDARILPAYLDARLSELKWAVVVQELAKKQREEQRYLKERQRDELKAREEYEEKMREAAREEETRRKAVEEAERKFATASEEQKAQYEEELQKLRQDLVQATEKKLTIAQQTTKGHVYIISNVGSFGPGIYKIGLTRRDPEERVYELSGASVPFEFDIHARISSENAPMLEHKIHKQMLTRQVNKINSRKEFFRASLAEIRKEFEKLQKGEDFIIQEWTEVAHATEYHESLDIDNNPQKKEIWLQRQEALAARQLRWDALSLVDSSDDNVKDSE